MSRSWLLPALWVGLACASETDETPPPTTEPVPTAPLRMKKFDQLQAELVRVLRAEPQHLCQELDSVFCASEAHRLVLGGPDAYGAQVYEADPNPGPTTPLAFERTVLATCRRRVEADLKQDGVGGLFRAVELDEGEGLDPESPAVRLAIQTLYRRALLREPTQGELERITAAYGAFESGPEPAVRWGSSVCAAVLSSREFVFY